MNGLAKLINITRSAAQLGRIIAPLNRSMFSSKDSHPRICQNVTARLVERVILPGIAALPVHEDVPKSGAQSQEEFLEWAGKHFDNATASDARAAFVLILAATYERHLRRWMYRRQLHKANTMPFEQLLGAGLDVLPDQGVAAELRLQLLEMVLVGNVLRHGNGRSVHDLRRLAPGLWHDLTPEDHQWAEDTYLYAEQMRIGEERVRAYANAIVLFWGLADALPGAVLHRGY